MLVKNSKMATAVVVALAVATVAHIAYYGSRDWKRYKELGKDQFLAEQKRILHECCSHFQCPCARN